MKKWHFGVIVGVILAMSVGFSALNTDMSVSGEATVRANADIHITNLEFAGQSGGGYEKYRSEYTVSTIKTSVSVPNANATVSYTGKIVNRSSNTRYYVKSITTSKTNEGILHDSVGVVAGDIIEPNSEVDFTITFNGKGAVGDLTATIAYEFEPYLITPPVISGVSGYVSSGGDFTVTVPGTASDGVVHYEYYLSENGTAPNESTTPTDILPLGASLGVGSTSSLTYYVWYRTVSVKGYKSGWSNRASIEIYKITAPTIRVNTTNWVTAVTVSLNSAGSAGDGVKHYEYYRSTSSSAPNANTTATGTTSNSLSNTTQGQYYYWYRTVSNNGRKSGWSNSVLTRVDRTAPTLSLSKSGGTSTSSKTHTISPTSIHGMYTKSATISNVNVGVGTVTFTIVAKNGSTLGSATSGGTLTVGAKNSSGTFCNSKTASYGTLAANRSTTLTISFSTTASCPYVGGTITNNNSSRMQSNVALSSAISKITTCPTTVAISKSDNVGITAMKWAAGSQSAAYFNSAGTTLSTSATSFNTGGNSPVTVWVRDQAGNATVRTITMC